MYVILPFVVGARDNAPLPEDPVPACWHTDRFARRDKHIGEIGKEQAETHYIGAGRETR